ncbi:pili assembly chaperone [Stenotrophomonas sp. SKA14]|uniref:fimbrial biogenesis chaperone n=1 Tax=Stenotrophomonas TaxID=40323 RepID=UPI00018FF123|nr:fimbria/pilus periplasmic chaperone [Stenotrophomonas sp. SKA14]EED39665.1 pili assembly chaperone [Stenotrophomonas sp. SKA14]
MSFLRPTVLCAAVLAASVFPASASVVIEGSRIIFPAGQREVSVRLNNTADTPSLVQTWIDDGDRRSMPATAQAPFVIRPPMFRIDGHKSQVVRILHAGQQLPMDRESLFFFNALEVSANAQGTGQEGNRLKTTVQSRLKLIHRPKGLNGQGMIKAASSLRWHASQENGRWALVTVNDSPYYINISSVEVGGTRVRSIISAPLSTTRHPLPDGAPKPTGPLKVEIINDHGGLTRIEAALEQR